ncbi:hypothetical protein NECID01_0898 [Nematocida sp. AWRm77]|nr:hypothetical protein NECID01_0898 [Nematocida sp. AWRm77]
MKYESTIKTRNKFTDKPMLLGSTVLLGIYLSYCGITLSSYKDIQTLFIDHIKSMAADGFMTKLGIVFFSSFVVSQIVVLLLFLVPALTIHTAAIGVIGLGFYTAYLSGSMMMVILPCITLAMYIGGFAYISKVSKLIRVVAQILLANTHSTVLYIFSCALTSLFLSAVLDFVKLLSEKTADPALSILGYSWLLFTVYTLFFMGYAGDVFFGRVVFKYLVSVAEKKHASVALSAAKRVVLSLGTILIATSLSFFIFVLRTVTNSIMDRTQNRDRNNSSEVINIAIMILMFIASFILYILEIAVDTINRYVLAHNSMFGESYRKSMTGAFEIAQKRQSFYGMITFMTSICLLFFNILFMGMVGVVLKKNYQINNIDLFKIALPSIITTYLYTASIMSGFLAFEFLIYEDSKLINAVYPGLFNSLHSIGYITI